MVPSMTYRVALFLWAFYLGDIKHFAFGLNVSLYLGNGKFISQYTRNLPDGTSVGIHSLDDRIGLTYVSGFASVREVTSLRNLVIAKNGFRQSDVVHSDGSKGACSSRTSASCAMLWPLHFRGQGNHLLLPLSPQQREELALCERLSVRAAQLLMVDRDQIEALQVVKYEAGQFFKPHCDWFPPEQHAAGTFDGEQRLFTLLLFASDMPTHAAGGHLHFPHLGLRILPRIGDACFWRNVDEQGEPDSLTLHEGEPPAAGYEKFAVNIWAANRPFDPIKVKGVLKTRAAARAAQQASGAGE
mmetsp:Transcript_29409/g.65846  ORF Transcript_29409/g.65846 Transcript_29409/m.65846 type:complete len:300 (+) Transcript_29409:1551-2450(+)